MANLRVTSGPLTGDLIAVERVLTVGRLDADIVIDDPELSRRHLEIRPAGDMLMIEDLGSTNGTLVDGNPIHGPTQIRGGARIQLGSSTLEVEMVATEAAATRIGQPAPDPDATRVSGVPPLAEPIPPPEPTPPPAAIPVPAQQTVVPEPVAVGPTRVPKPEEFGVFNPPTPRRGGGLASRSWIPVVLSFGSAIATAIALVIYFAQR